MPAIKHLKKFKKKDIEETFFKQKLVHRCPKIEISQKEIVIFYNRNVSTIFFLVLASARTTEK